VIFAVSGYPYAQLHRENRFHCHGHGTCAVSRAFPVSRNAAGEDQADRRGGVVYGLPLVMNYAVFYEYFGDKSGSEFKAEPNHLYNSADTPYSFVAMDLRAEPLVVCNPTIEKSRYFSLQLVDMYTFNFGYMGSRTTGDDAACAMITERNWKGDKPEGIAQSFQSETDFSFAIIRTQLFNSADIDNVKKVQAGYRGMTLSQFQNKPAPAPAPEIAWPTSGGKRRRRRKERVCRPLARRMPGDAAGPRQRASAWVRPMISDGTSKDQTEG
jgi:hypothetical protein